MTEYEYHELIEKAEKYDMLVMTGLLNHPDFSAALRIYYNHRDNFGKWDSVLTCKPHFTPPQHVEGCSIPNEVDRYYEQLHLSGNAGESGEV